MGREALKAGDVFLDYRITELIDAGGMGEVYKAVEEYSEDVVAIKCMSPRHVRREDFARRFRQECKFYPKLRHPNIVGMRKAGVSPEHVAYIVMDFLEGKTLRKVLNKVYRLDFLSAMHVMLQVADAMTFVHSKGIWHRDLKPENIMVGAKGDAKGHVWLLDFGIAKFADGGMNTDDLPDVGTVRYISPEQVKLLYGSERKTERVKPDGRTDIYAFGAIFYEVLTGKHLFLDEREASSAEETLTGHLVAAPEPVHEIVPDCPEYVWPVVSRCIAIEPGERYAQFGEVAKELRSLLRNPVPAGHVLARRLAQERMKAERQAAFSGVEMGEESALVEEEEEQSERGGAGSEERGSEERGEEREEKEERERRVTHAETAPLEWFVVPESPLPFTPLAREPAREPARAPRGVGYTEPLPATLPGLGALRARQRERESAVAAGRTPPEPTAALPGAWEERTGHGGAEAGMPHGAASYPPAALAYAAGPQGAGPMQQGAAPYPPAPPSHVAPPMSHGAAHATPPMAHRAAPYATPPLSQGAAPHATPPYTAAPLSQGAAPYATPPMSQGAAPQPMPAPAGAGAAARPERETAQTPALSMAQVGRRMRPYRLVPLLAVGLTAVGLTAALWLRARSGDAPEHAGAERAATEPAQSVKENAPAPAVPSPPPEASAAPVAPGAPEATATASAASTSTADAAAKDDATAKADAGAKEEPAATKPAPGRSADADADAEEDEEDIYPMPQRPKPSFLRVLNEQRKQEAPSKKTAPAKRRSAGAEEEGPCPIAGCGPQF
ncbi:protein kinase [Sorangium cellulosum]|uniref:Protein kinase n=2 Tax=Sorangium cellulosum TaxID=56 RepID=A0A2L0EJQ1_SORCE|nr:protein kinase [Sorangium cellulosum]